MDVHVKFGLSKEVYNRIFIWENALREAYSNLKVEDHIMKNMDRVDNRCNFEMAGQPCYTHSSLAACHALTEIAVILVRQVFSTGEKGNGIASNRGNNEVDKIREEMEHYAKKQLSWSDQEYTDFYRLIRDRRNQLLAHYDGVAAEYSEPAPWMSTIKMIGANLCKSERDKLEELVKVMLEFIIAKIRPM